MVGMLIAIGCIVAGLLSWWYYGGQTSFISPITQGQQVSPTPTPDPLAPKNIVILGYGGGGHEGGKLTDTIIVVHMRPREKKAVLITVPRDLWVPLPIEIDRSVPYKINAAFAIGSDDRNYPNKPDVYTGESGGGNLAKQAIETIIGQPVDYYIAISFAGFKQTIKTLGTLEIDVPYTFTDTFYPIEGKETETCGRTDDDILQLTATMSGFELEKQFVCRYETISFTQGKQPMDADTALKFVRSRHSGTGGGDFGRSQRQAALINAFRNKVLSLDAIPKLLPLLRDVRDMIETDVTAGDIATLAQLYGDVSGYKVITVSLTDQNVLKPSISAGGQYILIPKAGEEQWQDLRAFIQMGIDEITPTPTPTATPSGTRKLTPRP